MDFIQGHVRDVMTPYFFPPIRSNVTYSQKSGILENRAQSILRVNATFVQFLRALLLARKEQGRHDVMNMTLNEVHQTGKGESA